MKPWPWNRMRPAREWYTTYEMRNAAEVAAAPSMHALCARTRLARIMEYPAVSKTALEAFKMAFQAGWEINGPFRRVLPRRELLPFPYFRDSAPSLPEFPSHPCAFARS